MMDFVVSGGIARLRGSDRPAPPRLSVRDRAIAGLHRPVSCVVVAAVCSLALAATASAAPPTLDGEKLDATADLADGSSFTATWTCADPNPPTGHSGGSQGSFTSSGTALGPYPGTFTESGSFTISEENVGSPGFPGFRLTAFEASFTIISGEYRITGTKRLDPAGDGQGTCSGQHVQVQFPVLYEARIEGPTGVFLDQGGPPGSGGGLLYNTCTGCSPETTDANRFLREFFGSHLSEPTPESPPDVAAPVITITTPADGATYTRGSTVNANYSCVDETGGSGVASCTGTVPNGAAIDTATAGSKSFTVVATDNAGNTATKTVSYTVVEPPPTAVNCAAAPPPGAIVGTPGSDVITGTAGADVIFALGGSDVINGLGGDDTICAGAGNDSVNAGAGNDTVFGEAGDDAIDGGAGNDTLSGGDGNDALQGGDGDDTLNGGNGNDALQGGNGNDTLDGAANIDSCGGGAGTDSATGCEATSSVP